MVFKDKKIDCIIVSDENDEVLAIISDTEIVEKEGITVSVR